MNHQVHQTYVCIVCNETFQVQTCLSEHMIMNHPADPMCTCNVCEETFKAQTAINYQNV